MRSQIRHGGILKCDAPNCGETFLSYSMVSRLRVQAKNAGWLRVPGWQVIGSEDSNLHDVCPTHAVDAANAKAKRPEIMKAKREQAKAERAVIRAEKKKAKAAEKRKAKAEAKLAATGESP